MPRPGPEPIGLAWIKNEFDQINKKLDLILKNTPRLCTPELTKQVKLALALAQRAEKTLPNIK